MTLLSKPSRFAEPRETVRRAPSALIETQGALHDRPAMRRFAIRWLDASGHIHEDSRIAPAHPFFEDAFSAFSRGSIVTTATGPVAVEDLIPGDRIMTATGREAPLLWIGSMSCTPRLGLANDRPFSLTRIAADTFGLSRPEQFLVTGPGARLARRNHNARDAAQPQFALTRTEALRDGHHIIESMPPSTVQLFHLCLPQHAIITVGGLQFETYHPGGDIPFANTGLRAAFLGLFPHILKFSDFGQLAGFRIRDTKHETDQPFRPID